MNLQLLTRVVNNASIYIYIIRNYYGYLKIVCARISTYNYYLLITY